MKMYCINDSKVEAFLHPFFVNAKGEAIRGFTELANDPKTNIGKYASDFTLFELGEFDNATAKFVLHSTPISIGLALEFKHPSNNISTLTRTEGLDSNVG